jgi:hypothetical protein
MIVVHRETIREVSAVTEIIVVVIIVVARLGIAIAAVAVADVDLEVVTVAVEVEAEVVEVADLITPIFLHIHGEVGATVLPDPTVLAAATAVEVENLNRHAYDVPHHVPTTAILVNNSMMDRIIPALAIGVPATIKNVVAEVGVVVATKTTLL